jgi:NAD(P)-dependent dehydrogenase (short-subunit alcohol dehydrogenase family)
VPYQGLYSATKAAVEFATETLRMEVERFGVRVVLLEPGDFATGFTDNRRAAERANSEAYGAQYRRALDVAERDERSGPTPDRIGRQVARILRESNPRLRYTAGAPFQRLAVHLRTLLPGRLFRWGLRTYYHVG